MRLAALRLYDGIQVRIAKASAVTRALAGANSDEIDNLSVGDAGYIGMVVCDLLDEALQMARELHALVPDGAADRAPEDAS